MVWFGSGMMMVDPIIFYNGPWIEAARLKTEVRSRRNFILSSLDKDKIPLPSKRSGSLRPS